jgi:peroxiredoxin
VTVPDVGAVASDFTTKNQHGEDITLSALRGAPVVLVFYPFAFTTICTAELGDLRDHLHRVEAANARVLAVSTDTMFTLRVFAESEHLTFDLLSDHWPHGAIARRYGVFDEQRGCALRGTFVLNPDGRVAWRTTSGIGDARDIDAVLAALPAAAVPPPSWRRLSQTLS